MGLGVVDEKSTVVGHLLAFLLFDILPDHLVSDGSRTDREIAVCPPVSIPEFSPSMSKPLEPDVRKDSLPPRHDWAHVRMGPVSEKQVTLVACDLAGHHLPFVFRRHVPEEVPPTKSDLAGPHRFAVFRHPHPMHFPVALRVRVKSIMPPATTLHPPCFA